MYDVFAIVYNVTDCGYHDQVSTILRRFLSSYLYSKLWIAPATVDDNVTLLLVSEIQSVFVAGLTGVSHRLSETGCIVLNLRCDRHSVDVFDINWRQTLSPHK